MTRHAIFPDGAMYSGPTWAAVEAAIRDDWWNDRPTLEKFRAELAFRANVWNGAAVEHGSELSSRRFLAALEAAGVIRCENDDERTER